LAHAHRELGANRTFHGRQARFTDRQVRGPHAPWHHRHEFVAVDGGTHMTDKVDHAESIVIEGRSYRMRDQIDA